MVMHTRLLGLLTLGQSPRKDITSSLQAILGHKVILREAGALDRLKKKEINALAPKNKEAAIETRLGCGAAVLLARDRMMPHLVEAAERLQTECTQIVLLCSGQFPPLRVVCPGIIEPITLLKNIVRTLVGAGTLGIIGPASDLDQAPFQWQDCAGKVVCAAASPYGQGSTLARAASRAAEKGADTIFLDDMGFTEAHRLLARSASGIPTLAAMTLTARILTELI